jgi:hypothetical protein
MIRPCIVIIIIRWIKGTLGNIFVELGMIVFTSAIATVGSCWWRWSGSSTTVAGIPLVGHGRTTQSSCRSGAAGGDTDHGLVVVDWGMVERFE